MSDTEITPENAVEDAEVETALPEDPSDPPAEEFHAPETDAEPMVDTVDETEASADAPESDAEIEADAPETDAEPMVDTVDETEASADAPVSETAASDAAPVPIAAEESAGDEAALDDDVLGEDDLLEEEAAPPRVESPFDRPGRWYVVHTQSGHEKKAQQNLAARTESMNMEERIYESVIPMEDVVEFRNGKKVVVQKKMFPGYLLVRAELDDDAWYVVRNTPSIVNFVGSGGKPSPLSRREVENFLQVKEEGAPATPAARSKARLEYEMGETVRVKEGPFADFSGEIVEINEDQLKVKVLVNIFGRETPVELEFSQVARL